jgi:hypothetical protein
LSDPFALENDLLGVQPQSFEEQEAAEQKAKEEQELKRAYLLRLMGDDQFRAWLWSVLAGFGTFERRYGASPNGFPDDRATEYHLGMRDAGWFLWETFDNVAPDLASLMRREGTGVQEVVVRARRASAKKPKPPPLVG